MPSDQWQDLFDEALRRSPPPDSPTFAARRHAALGPLQDRVRARGRRRTVRRIVAAAVVLVAATGAVWFAARSWSVGSATPDGGTNHEVALGLPSVRVVHNDPDLLTSLTVRHGETVAVRRIDDTELARLLRATGRTAGVVRTPDRVLLAEEVAALTE